MFCLHCHFKHVASNVQWKSMIYAILSQLQLGHLKSKVVRKLCKYCFVSHCPFSLAG